LGSSQGPAAGWLTAALLLLLLPRAFATLGPDGNLLPGACPARSSGRIVKGFDATTCGSGAIPGLAVICARLAINGASSWVLIPRGYSFIFIAFFALVGSVLLHRLELGIEYRGLLQESIAERTGR